jgi:hypothetical protein
MWFSHNVELVPEVVIDERSRDEDREDGDRNQSAHGRTNIRQSL